jgi:tetratricopeptide (TPR) repeat protein
VDWRLERGYAAQNVAIVLLDLGRPAESLALGTQAAHELRDIARLRPDAIIFAAHATGWIARAQENLGHYEQAIATDASKLELALTAPGGMTNQDTRYLAAITHGETARLLLDLGRIDDSEALVRQAIEEQHRLVAHDPSNMDWLTEELLSRIDLCRILIVRGDLEAVRAQLAQVEPWVERLMAKPVPERGWRIGLVGHVTMLRGAIARTPAEVTAAEHALAAYLADVRRFEADGSIVTMEEIVPIGRNGLVEGDLLARLGRAADARAAWAQARRRVQPLAATGEPRAMTLLGHLDIRLGDLQAARVLADSVKATSYRHPAYADLLTSIGQAQKTGASPGS